MRDREKVRKSERENEILSLSEKLASKYHDLTCVRPLMTDTRDKITTISTTKLDHILIECETR